MSRHEAFDFASPATLLAKVRELRLELPFEEDVGPLLEPIEIAGRRGPNRLAVQPMEGCDANERGGPGELTARRYQRFAAGGSGLIWFEATAVVPEGRANPRQLVLCGENVGEFRRVVELARRAAQESMGAGHDVLCVLQLTHSGRYCRPEGAALPVLAQHNGVLDPPQGLAADYPLISDAALDRLQDAYVRAAELAAEAGFDGVDIKACHGYLVSELLAAHTRGGSRYGGPFENRTRFLLEVAGRIRERLPGLIVASRINAYDGLPHPWGFGADREHAGVENLSEAQALAVRLRELGCSLLNVSAGIPYFNPHLGRPFDKPMAEWPKPLEHPLVGVARLLRIGAGLQQAVPNVAVVGTGYTWLRHFFPHVAAGVVRSGWAGLAGVGRLALAYPDYAKDLAQRGALDPLRVCVTCSGCTEIMRDGGSAGCVRRDPEIYAAEHRRGRRRARDARG